MPEIRHSDLEAYCHHTQDRELAPIYLIHGDDFFCRQAFDRLIRKLLPETDRNVTVEHFDGENENLADALAQLNTYSLLANRKVVVIRDSRIFYSHQESSRMFEKARQAFLEKDMERAAGCFVSFMALSNLDFEDLDGENRSAVLNFDVSDDPDQDWIDQVIVYCREKNKTVPLRKNVDDRLAASVEKGFPPGNRMIIITDFVDKRKGLYKVIKEKGVVVDCEAPKGVRKADKDAQQVLLNDSLKAILSRSGKTMEPRAAALLMEHTGFDLQTFTATVEKLIDYSGKRSRIALEDVQVVSQRTKTDPIFELTNAVADRNPEKSFFFLNSLLASDMHPLQVLAALVNQTRKLLLARSILDRSGIHIRPNMSLNEFKSDILPRVIEADACLVEEVARWNQSFSITDEDVEETGKSKKVRGRKMFSTELPLAKNPNNPYPIMQTLRQAANYSARELAEAVTDFQLADRRIKTMPLDPGLIVQKAVADMLIRRETPEAPKKTIKSKND